MFLDEAGKVVCEVAWGSLDVAQVRVIALVGLCFASNVFVNQTALWWI